MQQLLVESDARLEHWRAALREGLGNIAQALVDLLPELAFIVGEVPPAPALGPRETQARLSLAVQRFLGVCGSKSRPLVLFLDDLQWSDAGSRFLLEDLLCSDLPEGLLLIGAFHSSDVGASHPMTALLGRLAERRIAIESIGLSTLAPAAGVAMLAEALERSLEDTRSLGQLVERKTGNNPMLLRRHGIRWPLHPSPWRTRMVLRRVLWKLRKGSRRELLHRAKQVDPRWLAPILITGASGGVMTRVDVHLVVLVSCWIMDSNLRRGYVARPVFSLIAFATWVQVVLGNAREAERLAQLALEWSEKVPDAAFKPRVEMQLYAILRPWWTRRKQTLASMDRVAENMREIGDLEYAYYARFLKVAYGALAGESFAEAESAFAELADAVRRSGQRYLEPERCHAAYRLLLSGDPASLESAVAESDAWIEANRGSAEVYIRTFWMLVFCVHNRFDLALAQSERAQERLFQIVPYVHVADHTFLRGLTVAALATTARGAERREHSRALAAALRRMRRWARHGPDFVHMEAFLSAEQMRLRGDADAARVLYDKAAHGAKAQDYVHHALACERRGRMLAALRRETEAGASLREAVALYARWGATPKAEALE